MSYKFNEQSIRMNIQFPDASIAIEAAQLGCESEEFEPADIRVVRHRYRNGLRIALSGGYYLRLTGDAPLVAQYRSVFGRQGVSAGGKAISTDELFYVFKAELRKREGNKVTTVHSQQLCAFTFRQVLIDALAAARSVSGEKLRLVDRQGRVADRVLKKR